MYCVRGTGYIIFPNGHSLKWWVDLHFLSSSSVAALCSLAFVAAEGSPKVLVVIALLQLPLHGPFGAFTRVVVLVTLRHDLSSYEGLRFHVVKKLPL